MSSIFHRSLTKQYPTASSGDGVYLLTTDGRRILDGSSGAAVSCLGHSNREVISAIIAQAQSMAYAHTSFYSSHVAEELAALLIDQSDSAFSKVMFLSSGSEAIESAIKLARHYHVCNDDTDRVHIISRKYSYHGNTLGALAAGHNPPRRDTFLPLLSPAFHHVSPCFYSRDGKSDETESQYVKRLIVEFEEMFQNLGPSTIAAVLVETVAGSTLGCIPAPEDYLSQLRDLCHKHGVLLIYDEVMCGMGRSGTLHAWQSVGNCAPDLQAVGKGIGAGYQPLAAVFVGDKIHRKINERSSTFPFISAHTYQGHAICCAAGLATQKYLVKENLLSNVRQRGKFLTKTLHAKLPKSVVKETRGLGLFQAVEFTPIDPAGGALTKDVAELAFTKGAAIYQCSSAVDAIMFAPPFIISEEQIEELVGIVTEAVLEVLNRRGIKF